MLILGLKYLKTSSLQGLLLFLYIYEITLYYYLFCYATIQIIDIQKSTPQKTPFAKKLRNFSAKYLKALLKFDNLQKSRLQKPASIQKQFKYCLQKRAYSKKHSKYCLKALKSSLNMLKSSQKFEKAFVKHSINLLLSTFILLLRLIFYQSPQSHSIFFNQSSSISFNLKSQL